MSEIIRAVNITKTYMLGEVPLHVLKGISLTVGPGDFISIMGSSGSGKSTLMNILGCLDKATAGEYYLNDRDVNRLNDNELSRIRNNMIGFVFQNFSLLSRTSALENVELPATYGRQLSSRQLRERAMEVLATVGLSDRAHHYPNQLSGGQQQRVAIARALVNRPALLLADEPTGNLDSASTIEIMQVFRRLNDDGMTVVLITHEPDIAYCAKRILRMRDGRFIKEEAVSERMNLEEELAKLKSASEAQAEGQV
ncbi:MAG: ABC transporter ATP-binding protein [Planctomycetota bacterium]